MGLLGMLSLSLWDRLEKSDFLVFGSFDAFVLHVGLHNKGFVKVVCDWFCECLGEHCLFKGGLQFFFYCEAWLWGIEGS